MNGPVAPFEIGEDVLYQSINEEVVLLNLANQQFYGVNSMGARIWHLLLEYGDVSAVADQLCKDYDVEKSRALADVELLARSLHSAGLLKCGKGIEQ